ncbi:hypothetical protein NUW58_g7238 [Xylaria curta]|uniref:Uncharacterized protein n=1 Tax=Xylaria curta TaxID=42375 RepID=A0ACC1NIZ7_9PEZI|nr:hypothetical protein NUW58_g7238 [Xylaria curta]
MPILCCCRNRQAAAKESHTEAVELPTQPPRARLSKTLSRSDTNMYLSSILASRGPSQLTLPTYHNIVDPEGVDADDSDDDGPERDTRVSNTGALGSFRTKLIRRLSHRTDTKTSSRSSVSTSNEELARRAELKRLMHKRIQEELKSEEEEDDLRLATPRRRSISNCKEPELSRGGPRDTIEFSVSADEQETKKEVDMSPEISLPSTPVIGGPQEPCEQQIGCSGSAKRSITDSYHGCNASLDEMGSSIQRPPPSCLTPVHISGGSGRESPSTASWRLSYSAIHIESYIEPLVEAGQSSHPQSPELEPENSFSGQEGDTATNSSNPTIQDETISTRQTAQLEQQADPNGNQKENDSSNHSPETSDGRYSPLDMWLRSQDLRCSSILSSPSDSGVLIDRPRESKVSEVAEGHGKFENSISDLSGLRDYTVDTSSNLQEHDLEAWPKLPKHSINGEKASITTPSNESIALRRILHRMENALPPEGSITEDQAQDVSSRYTSSRYTTRPNSQQATPGGSRLSLAELLGSRRIPQQLSPIYGPISPYRATTSDKSDISSYRTALNKTPSSDQVKPKLELPQVHMAKALSTNASETASLRQREEELKSIKKRFGLTPARRYPIAPVRSKFREEFEDSKGLNSGRISIFSKLHLSFPKRARTSSSHTELNKSEEENGIRATNSQNPNEAKSSVAGSNKDQYQPPNMVSETYNQKSAVSQWQRLTKQDANARPGRLKAKLVRVSKPKTDIYNTGARTTPVSSFRLNATKEHAADSERRDSAEKVYSPSTKANNMAILKEAETKDTVDIHAGVLQEWVHQLQAEDVQRQTRTESRVDVPKRQHPRPRTPPESWAKWPSHTRDERTAPAGKKDKVNSFDFAMSMNSNYSKIEAEDKASSKERELTATSRNLSSQVGKALKLGWNKMITRTGSLGRASDQQLETQRARRSHGFLEYPELELLPTAAGYREVQALDQQIGAMKRHSMSKGRTMPQSSSDGGRRLLASRIAEEVHKFQTIGDETSSSEVEHRAQVSPTRQFLPAHALSTGRPKSCDPELSGAPEPQCPYEDCVQTQILDSDNDNTTAKDQDRATIKRAKSTGNIEAKLSGNMLAANEAASSSRGPVYKTRTSGLRRHQSLGWIRGHRRSGDRDKLSAV